MLQSDLNRQLPLLAGLLLWSLARLDTSRTAYICASLLSTSAFLTVIHLRREWVFVMCRCLFIVGGHNIMNPSTVRRHIQGRTWTIRVKKTITQITTEISVAVSQHVSDTARNITSFTKTLFVAEVLIFMSFIVQFMLYPPPCSFYTPTIISWLFWLQWWKKHSDPFLK